MCQDLKELGTELINFEEKEMTSLTSDDITLYESQKVCYDKNKNKKIKLYKKFRDNCHNTGKFREAAHSECNLRYKVT